MEDDFNLYQKEFRLYLEFFRCLQRNWGQCLKVTFQTCAPDFFDHVDGGLNTIEGIYFHYILIWIMEIANTRFFNLVNT